MRLGKSPADDLEAHGQGRAQHLDRRVDGAEPIVAADPGVHGHHRIEPFDSVPGLELGHRQGRERNRRCHPAVEIGQRRVGDPRQLLVAARCADVFVGAQLEALLHAPPTARVHDVLGADKALAPDHRHRFRRDQRKHEFAKLLRVRDLHVDDFDAGVRERVDGVARAPFDVGVDAAQEMVLRPAQPEAPRRRRLRGRATLQGGEDEGCVGGGSRQGADGVQCRA